MTLYLYFFIFAAVVNIECGMNTNVLWEPVFGDVFFRSIDLPPVLSLIPSGMFIHRIQPLNFYPKAHPYVNGENIGLYLEAERQKRELAKYQLYLQAASEQIRLANAQKKIWPAKPKRKPSQKQ